MARRRSTRRRHRNWLVFLALVAAAAFVGASIWSALQPSQLPPPPTEMPSQVQQPSTPTSGAEDFTAAERQDLESVLKRGGTRKRQ
jgi:cytoskeletal protein RodZ